MPIIVHSGLGKTATTSLQELVFPNTASHIFLGKCKSAMQFKPPQEQETSTPNFLTDPQALLILGNYFTTCHQLIHLISDSKDQFKKITAKLLILNKIKHQIKTRNLHESSFIFSHEKLSLVIDHFNPPLGTESASQYPFRYHKELFSIFGDCTFLNTTRQAQDFFASMYLQLMEARIVRGGSVVNPTIYFEWQKKILEDNPKKSIFWAFRTWSSKTEFSKEFQIPEDLICTLSLEEIIQHSPTISLSKHTNIRFTESSIKKINNNFEHSPHKRSKTEKTKKEIIKALSKKNKIPEDKVLLWIKQYISTNYTNIINP